MIKRIAIAAAAVIIIGGTGYFFLSQPPSPTTSQNPTPQEEKTEEIFDITDKVFVFLKSLAEDKELSYLGFSAIQTIEMQWNVFKNGKTEELVLEGRGTRVNGMSDYRYKNIKNFFSGEERQFEIDIFNIVKGSVTDYIGYKKDDIVCTVAGQIKGYEPDDKDEEFPIRDVTVKCGKLPSEL